MAYTTTTTNSTSKYTKSEKSQLENYHSDSFLVSGTITEYQGDYARGKAYSKLTRTTAQYSKISITNKVGTTYNLVIFEDQDPEFWELTKLPLGASIDLLIHKADYGHRFGDCHRVNSVVSRGEVDNVRRMASDPRAHQALCLLLGMDPSNHLQALIKGMVINSSHGWKFGSMSTHRATPL